MEHSNTGGKGIGIALVAGAAVGAILLFFESSKASTTPTTVDPCVKLTQDANKVLDKATKADVDQLKALAESAKALGCTDLFTAINKKLIELGTTTVPPVVPPVVKPPTAIFNAANAPNPIGAHAIAFSIGKTPACCGATPASDGTFRSLSEYSSFLGSVDPTAVSTNLGILQRAAGITPDGVYGPQTERAFQYFFSRSTRPDGSSDTRAVSVAGETSSEHEAHDVAVAGCAACEAGDPRQQVQALNDYFCEYGGVPFGSIPFGGNGANGMWNGWN